MKKLIFVFVILISTGNTSRSQETNYEIRTEEVRNELAYKENTKRAIRLKDHIREELENQEEVDESENIIPQGVSQFFKFIGYILILIIVSTVLLLMLKFIRPRLNGRQAVPNLEEGMSTEEIEDIGDINIDSLLETALQRGDYRAAIRTLFLQNLQILNTQKSIYWQKHKTNRDYLRESSGQKHYDAFLAMIMIYEGIWYGNQNIDAATYQSISPKFGADLLKIDTPDGQ